MEENYYKGSGAGTVRTIILTALITALICFIGFKSFYYKEVLEGNVSSAGNSGGETLAATISGDFTSGERRTLEKLLLQSKMNRVKNIIDSDYLYDYDSEKMMDYIAIGMLAALDDPYAQYYDKKSFESFYTQTEGEYSGIGVYVTYDKEKNMPIVLLPIEGSPAEKSGIQAGDYIEYVDDLYSVGSDYDTVIDAIKGIIGTTVKVGLIRQDEDKNYTRLEVEVERQKIQINPVKSSVYSNNIGYIRLTSFDDNTYTGFKEKYDELTQNPKIKGLIIDLRDNPGGILERCAEITDLIVPKGKVVYTVDNKGQEETIYSDENAINIPLVVLVNENSASASEVFTAAIKDYGVGVIVGKKTYGKGVVQTLRSLRDGTYMKITTQEYFSPNGNKINEVGIEPDVEVDLPEEVKSSLSVEYEKDTQLQKAIEVLKGKI
ncbi:MAG: S41 family peptidase [Clostridia bacterium]|nr:S41 family peptidase [Clostridia bacterium]